MRHFPRKRAELGGGKVRFEMCLRERARGITMKRNLTLGLMALVALAVPALAMNGVDSGLGVGEMVPAFQPHHLSGPDKDTNTCPVCTYGALPAVQVWLNSNATPEDITAFAKLLDKAATTHKKAEFKAFVINLTDCQMCVGKVTGVAKDSPYKNVDIATLSSSNGAVKAFKFNKTDEVKNTVFVYKDRKVVEKFVNLKPDKEGMAKLNAAIEKVATS